MLSWWVIGTVAAVYLVARYARVRRFDRELSQVITLYPDTNGVYRYLADHHFAPRAGRARCFFEAASLEALT